MPAVFPNEGPEDLIPFIQAMLNWNPKNSSLTQQISKNTFSNRRN
jgi:hypothetical protein